MKNVDLDVTNVDRTTPVILILRDSRSASMEYKRATFSITKDSVEEVMEAARSQVSRWAANAGVDVLSVHIYDISESAPELSILLGTAEGDFLADEGITSAEKTAAERSFTKWQDINVPRESRRARPSRPVAMRSPAGPETDLGLFDQEPEPAEEPGLDGEEPLAEPLVDEEQNEPHRPELTGFTAREDGPALGHRVAPPRMEVSEVEEPTPSGRAFFETSIMDEGKNDGRATDGWQGLLNRVFRSRLAPSADEMKRRAWIESIAQGWDGTRYAAVLNTKGGAGKALSSSEPVLTATGYRPIGSLVVGDEVYGRDGLLHQVRGVFPQGVRELFDVTFSDGTVVRADGEHLWEVQTPNERHRAGQFCLFPGCERPVVAREMCRAHYGQDRRGVELGPVREGNYRRAELTGNGNRVVTTAQMVEAGLGTDRGERGVRHRFFVPVACPVEFPPVAVPLDPYLLGALLGDGYLGSGTPQFSSADAETVELVGDLLPDGVTVTHKGGCDYRLSGRSGGANPLTVILKYLGVWGNRSEDHFVPEAYKLNSARVRTAVLQGLMDADGCAERGEAASFASVSTRLVEDVKFLAESLGCVVSMLAPRRGYYIKDGQRHEGQMAYGCRIVAPQELELFQVKRKRDLVRVGQRPPQRAVVSIEPAGSGEAVCISVDSADHLFLTRSCVPTHNTPTAITMAATAAEHSTMSVAVLDNNEGAGNAYKRIDAVNPHRRTARHLADFAERSPMMSRAELEHHMLVPRHDRYQMLAAHQPNLTSPGLSRDEAGRVHDAVSRFYQLGVEDSGNSWETAVWRVMLERAGQLVVPLVTAPDRFDQAAQDLEMIRGFGPDYAQLAERAIIVVSQWQPGHQKLAQDYARRWEGKVGPVVVVPYDPHLASHDLRLDRLHRRTRDAFLELTARVAEGLRGELG